MRTSYVVGVVVLVLVVAVALYLALQPTAPPPAAQTPRTPTPTVVTTPTQQSPAVPPTGPIVMCVIYNPRSPVLKGQIEAFKLAIREMNERGGIAGRQVVVLEADHQGKADLAVTAYRDLVIGRGCRYVVVDGVSEIALAVEEAAASIYPTFPNVVICPGQAAMATTVKVINEYNKYKFYFRPLFPEVEQSNVLVMAHFDIIKNIIGARRVALFLEDAAWTLCAREGCTITTAFGNYSFKPIRQLVEERFGLDVVYEVKIAVGEKNFVPMLEEAARRGAEAIFVLSSWYTDTVTLTKQWAASAARDIPLVLHAGPNGWQAFWNMTGGDALGVVTIFTDTSQYPYLRTRDVVSKLRAIGVNVDLSVLMYYSAAYLFKDAIEKVGDPNNIEAVIKALEELKFDKHAIFDPDYAYLGRKDYLFHSYPGIPLFMAQFQCNGRVAFVGRPEFYRQYYSQASVDWSILKPEAYKPPARLRAECK